MKKNLYEDIYCFRPVCAFEVLMVYRYSVLCFDIRFCEVYSGWCEVLHQCLGFADSDRESGEK